MHIHCKWHWWIQRGGGGGGTRDARPGGPNSFLFSCSFRQKKLQYNTNLEVGAPTSGKSWIHHWMSIEYEQNCVHISNQNDLHQNCYFCRSEKNAEYCEMPLVLSSSGILVSFAHVYLSILIMCALYVALILTLRKQQKILVWKFRFWYRSVSRNKQIHGLKNCNGCRSTMFQSVDWQCLT